METVQEYEIIIRLTKENGRYGAAAETVSGGLLESVPPLSAARNDALHALLHAEVCVSCNSAQDSPLPVSRLL